MSQLQKDASYTQWDKAMRFCVRQPPGRKGCGRTPFVTVADMLQLITHIRSPYLMCGDDKTPRHEPGAPTVQSVVHAGRYGQMKRARDARARLSFETDIRRADTESDDTSFAPPARVARQLVFHKGGLCSIGDGDIHMRALALSRSVLASFGPGREGVLNWFRCRSTFAGRFGGTRVAKALSTWQNSRLEALKGVAGVPVPKPARGSDAYKRMTRGSQLQTDAAEEFQRRFGGVVRETPRGESGGYMLMKRDGMLAASPDFFWWDTRHFPFGRQLVSTEEEKALETELPSCVAAKEYAPAPFRSLYYELRRNRRMLATFGHEIKPTPVPVRGLDVGRDACFMIDGACCVPGEIKCPTYVYDGPSWEHVVQMNTGMLLSGKPYTVYVVYYTLKLMPLEAVDRMLRKKCIGTFVDMLHLWKDIANTPPLRSYEDTLRPFLQQANAASLADLSDKDLKDLFPDEDIAAGLKWLIRQQDHDEHAKRCAEKRAIDVFHVAGDDKLQLVIWDFVRCATPVALLYRQYYDMLVESDNIAEKLRENGASYRPRVFESLERRSANMNTAAKAGMRKTQRRWCSICEHFLRVAASVADDADKSRRSAHASLGLSQQRGVASRSSSSVQRIRVDSRGATI